MDDIALVRTFRNSNFDNIQLCNRSRITLKFNPTKVNVATRKFFVDNAIDEPSLVSDNKGKDFSNYSLSKTWQIILNSEPTHDNHVLTKFYLIPYLKQIETDVIYQ